VSFLDGYDSQMVTLKDLSMRAGMCGDETSAKIIAAARNIIGSAHATGPTFTNGEAAKWLNYESKQREEADKKLERLRRLANKQSILTTEDKVMVGLLFTVGGAGLILGVMGMVWGAAALPALVISTLGATSIYLGKIGWKQAHDFAVDQLR